MLSDGVRGEIGYLCASDVAEVGNGIVLGGKGSFPLNPTMFRAQHGSTRAPWPLKASYRSEVVPLSCEIRSARSWGPRLCKDGFELVSDLNLGPINDDYARRVEEIAQAVTGATRARAYCSAVRRAKEGERKTYAEYAHSDMGHESWCPKLRDVEKSELPPGLLLDDDENIKRYAVVSAWRYLGPEATCRHSHLALLDPRSVKRDDAVHFEIRTSDSFGSNYRLKAPSSSKSAPHHHAWWYFPNMDANSELLFFTVYDSRPTFDAHGALGIPTIIHSAFQDPTRPVHEPQRQSLDLRIFLTWE